jgi:hypothetical protein
VSVHPLFLLLYVLAVFAVLAFFGAIFVALGLIPMFAKPEGLRPPWWDWGMDKAEEERKKEEIEVVVAPPVDLVVEDIEVALGMPPKGFPRW